MAGTDDVAEAQAYSLRHGQNTLISSYTVNGVIHYPHYWSTYCIHLNHADCRMTCKTCQAPCLCPCHRKVPVIDGPGAMDAINKSIPSDQHAE